MAKRQRATTQKTIENRIREGRGQGKGSNYVPWQLIQDFPSQGPANRLKGWKTCRVHHLMSTQQINYFYILEWSPVISDIREHYPLLPLEETLAIAEECGISHPQNPTTQEPLIITTDFLITVRQSIGTTEQARTVKLVKELQSQRTLETLEIERQYWQSRGIDWGIATEREIPKVVAKNVAWLHPAFNREYLSHLSESEINLISTALTMRLSKNNFSLAQIAAECDNQLGMPPGSSLSVARHLIANKVWLVDMNKPLQPSEKLVLLATPLEEQQKVTGGA